MKSVTSFPIERAIQKRKRGRKEILSIVLHIVSSFSARERERKRRILNHYNAVVIDAISTDFHAASLGVYDAAATDVYAISTGAEGAASSVMFDADMDVHDAASTGA